MKKISKVLLLIVGIILLNYSTVNAETLTCTTMRSGSTGENVKVLQRLLNEKVGCNLDVDGSYGPRTRSCVIKYQQANNIQVDGVVGPETCASLNNTLKPVIQTYKKSSINRGVIITEEANIRKRPTTTSEILTTRKSGNVLIITGKINNWYKVKISGQTAYIRSDLIAENCIVVDITNQRLTYYKDGQKEWSTNVVTGNAGNHDTPVGNYVLNPANFRTQTYLRGTNDNGTKYASYVDYWMPFITDRGIGFHDASWRSRSAYTKTTYQGNGSHGCVNMMHEAAEKLYNETTTSINVVVK